MASSLFALLPQSIETARSSPFPRTTSSYVRGFVDKEKEKAHMLSRLGKDKKTMEKKNLARARDGGKKKRRTMN